MGGANGKRITKNTKNKSARRRWLKAIQDRFREQDITITQIDSVCPATSFVRGFDLKEMRRLMTKDALAKGSFRETPTGFHVVNTSHKSSSKRSGRVARGGEKKPTGKTLIPREVIPALVLLVLERLCDSDVRQPSVGDIWSFDSQFQEYSRSAVGVLLASMVSDDHLEVQGPKGRYWYRVTKKGVTHLRARKPKEERVEKPKATSSPKSASSGAQPPVEKKSAVSLAGFSRDEENRREMLVLFHSHAGDEWFLRSEYSTRLRERFGWEGVAGNAIGRVISALENADLLKSRGEGDKRELGLSSAGWRVLGMEVPDDLSVPAQPVKMPQAEVAAVVIPEPVEVTVVEEVATPVVIPEGIDLMGILEEVAGDMGHDPEEVFGPERRRIVLVKTDSSEIRRLTAELEAERKARQVAEADAAQVRVNARLLAEAVPAIIETLDSLRSRLASFGVDISLPEN